MENLPHIKKELTGYIIRDVFSSLGLSIYILADTYFIAYAVGPIIGVAVAIIAAVVIISVVAAAVAQKDINDED